MLLFTIVVERQAFHTTDHYSKKAASPGPIEFNKQYIKDCALMQTQIKFVSQES